MYILGIESSCDETSMSIIKDGTDEIATVVLSQMDTHAYYGGVVPEIASRMHVENITIVLDEVLRKAEMTMDEIDAIGVTFGPGLIGSLLIGLMCAKTLAFIYNKPLIPVHHIAGHIYANNLVKPLEFPLIALVVSGGHTELIYMKDNYFDKNIRNNKITMCHYGILKSLAHLLSGYLSNCINKSLNESNSKENISVENKKDNKINQEFILDYIKNKVLFNQTIQNTSYPAFFINYIFRDKNVLHYFIVHYTNYTIKKYMENNKDQSLSEVNLIIQEMTEKNRAILNYIQQNPYFILLMKDIINSFIEFDLSMLNPNNNNYLKNTQDKKN